jgi:hypothetical protein
MQGYWWLFVLGGIGLIFAGWWIFTGNEAIEVKTRTSKTVDSYSVQSYTSPVTYVSTSSETVKLTRHKGQDTATLRGVGYASLPLQRASATRTATVYKNSAELLEVQIVADRLQIFAAGVPLFTGTAATTVEVE